MKTTSVMITSFITNLFLIIFKILFGIIGSSSALIADGIHSFSDLVTDIFAMIGLKIANKPADEKHPYGHGKLEYLISLSIGIIVIVLGINIIYNSLNKEIVVPNLLVAVISLITVIVKWLLSNYIIKKGKEYKNNILISSGTESRTDVISSVVVLISIILMNLSDKMPILKYADILATIIVGILILKIGFEIIKDNISVLIEEQETDQDIRTEVENIFYEDEKIYNIDNLVILKFGPYNKLIAEVSMDHTLSLLEAHDRVEIIENKLKKIDKIKYVTVHINPYIDARKYEIRDTKDQDIKYIKRYNKIDLNDNEIKDKYKIIYLDNKKIGNINYYIKNNNCYIESIYLIKRYQNKKIERRIIKDFIKKYNKVISKTNYPNLGFRYDNKTSTYIVKK